MDLQQEVAALNAAIEEFADRARIYFAQIDDQERYGWIAEGVGAALALTGIVLWIL